MRRPPKHQAHVFREAPTKGLVAEFAREIESYRPKLAGQAVTRAEAAIAVFASDPCKAPFYAIGPEMVLTK